VERTFRLLVYGATVPFVNGIICRRRVRTTTATKPQQEGQGEVGPLDHIVRPLRADARRNRAKVLEAAEEVFASEGLAVPVDEVARRAGVGVGTVYRHFPTKQALFEAIVVARIETLVERGEELCTAEDPGAALFTFISELVDLAVEKKDLSDELARAGVESERLLCGVKERLERCFDLLLERAQATGVVRPDINRTDVDALVMGTCMAANQHGCSESTQRLVGVLCDGFRVGAKPQDHFRD
jgi:AcrR family transcriptional regulator